jgi:hypothetical protein
MSKQINFFITPEDYEAINTLLIEKEIIVSYRSICGIWEKTLPDLKKEIHQVFLSKKEFLDTIYYNSYINKENKTVPYYDIDSSNILEFSLGGFYPSNIDILHRARLYYPTSFYDNNGEYFYKSKEFIDWCDDFRKVLKKRFLKRYEKEDMFWYSQSAIDWIESHNAKLTFGGQKWESCTPRSV